MASYRPLSISASPPLHPYDGPQTKRLFCPFGKDRRHDVEAAQPGLDVRAWRSPGPRSLMNTPRGIGAARSARAVPAVLAERARSELPRVRHDQFDVAILHLTATTVDGRAVARPLLPVVGGEFPGERRDLTRGAELGRVRGQGVEVEDRAEHRQRAVAVVRDLDEAGLLRPVDV